MEPVIEAEIAYSTVTDNELLREAVFKGLRAMAARSHYRAHTAGRDLA